MKKLAVAFIAGLLLANSGWAEAQAQTSAERKAASLRAEQERQERSGRKYQGDAKSNIGVNDKRYIDTRSVEQEVAERPVDQNRVNSYLDADKSRAEKNPQRTISVEKIARNSYGTPTYVEPSRK